jgi:hypothetical protein
MRRNDDNTLNSGVIDGENILVVGSVEEVSNGEVMAMIMPLIVLNQMNVIYPLTQQVEQAKNSEDAKLANSIAEKIFSIDISPMRSLFHLFMMGGEVQPGVGYQDFEIALRNAFALQYKTTLPQLVLSLFNSGLVDADDFAKIVAKDSAFDMASHIKELAVTSGNDSEEDEQVEQLDYSELALVIAIKQKDWDYILDSNLLSEGVLEDQPELISDIYDSNRYDLIEECRKFNVFSDDEEYVAQIDAIDEDGNSKLMIASTAGDVVEVKRLLALGANPAIIGSNGLNALMCAVSYTAEELAEINKASRNRSAEIVQKMQNRLEIVKVLTNDKRVSISATNKHGQTAYEIAMSQALVSNDRGFYELRGDHDVMEALLNAGSSLVVGKYEWSFKAKSMMTLALSVVVTGFKNYLVNLAGLGIVGRFIFSPVIEFLNVICDSIIAYKAYYDAKNPLYRFTRTFLDNEYANDAFFDLSKKSLIGAFYVNWYGKVIAGDELRKYISNHVGYTGVANGYFEGKDLPVDEEGKPRLRVKEKVELKNEIFNNYTLLKQKQASLQLPWTREGINNVIAELEGVYANIEVGMVLPEEVVLMIRSFSHPQSHERTVQEVLSSKENTKLFFQMYGLIQSGAIYVDLETRYNYEQLAMKVKNPSLLQKSFFEKVLESQNQMPSDLAEISFSAFAKHCAEFDYKGYKFSSMVHTINYFFANDIRENKDVRNFWEKFKDGFYDAAHRVANKTADGVGYVCGVDRETVFDYAAEGVAIAGATGNAAAHVGARRFYDSNYFIPACMLAGAAYLTVKWPDKVWQGCKMAFQAISLVIGLCLSALSMVFKSISNIVSYTGNKNEASTAIGQVIDSENCAKQASTHIRDAVLKQTLQKDEAEIGQNTAILKVSAAAA